MEYTKEQIEEIVKTYPTPFHLYDEAGIRANAKAVQEAFAWNKGFREYFAVKATPNPFLINILADKEIVPELLQDKCTVQNLAETMIRLIANPKQPVFESLKKLGQGQDLLPSEKMGEILLSLALKNKKR